MIAWWIFPLLVTFIGASLIGSAHTDRQGAADMLATAICIFAGLSIGAAWIFAFVLKEFF